MITGFLIFAAADVLVTLIVIVLARRNRAFRERLDAAFALLIGKAYVKVVNFGERRCPPCEREHADDYDSYDDAPNYEQDERDEEELVN